MATPAIRSTMRAIIQPSKIRSTSSLLLVPFPYPSRTNTLMHITLQAQQTTSFSGPRNSPFLRLLQDNSFPDMIWQVLSSLHFPTLLSPSATRFMHAQITTGRVLPRRTRRASLGTCPQTEAAYLGRIGDCSNVC